MNFGKSARTAIEFYALLFKLKERQTVLLVNPTESRLIRLEKIYKEGNQQ